MNSTEIARLVNKVRDTITIAMISKARCNGSYSDPNTGIYIEVFRSITYDNHRDAENKLRAIRSEFTEWGGWGEISAEIIPEGNKFRVERVQFCVRKYSPARAYV